MMTIVGVLDHPEIFDYLDISNAGMFGGGGCHPRGVPEEHQACGWTALIKP